jgi:hypothetical protein
MNKNKIIEDGRGDKKYFYLMPNIVNERGLSVHAFRLYCEIKRTTGEGGVCYKSTRNLAEICMMAVGTVTKAKKELVEKGLIRITKEHLNGKKGSLAPNDIIEIVNIWDENMGAYLPRSLDERETKSPRSPDERENTFPRSPHERPRSPDERKKTPLRRIPLFEEEDSTPSGDGVENGNNGKKPKAKKKKDERLKHPALLAYRDRAHLTVQETWRDAVIKAIGDEESEVDAWKNNVHTWIGNGWNPKNIRGMLEFHRGRSGKALPDLPPEDETELERMREILEE